MIENSHDCASCFEQRRATRNRPYHFLDSGLPNVYLVGVKYWVCQKCGAQAAEIPAAEQLMNLIAEVIVMKPGLLTGLEIKFLRKRAGKKASDFARLIGRTPEHLSKLETGALPISETMDKLIRLSYGLLNPKSGVVQKIIPKTEDWLKSIGPSRKPAAKINIRKGANSWLIAA
jgi:putative zinc finger/helix-turn-helix YgiT family protein